MTLRQLALAFLILLEALAMGHAAAADEPRPFVKGSWQEIRRSHAGRPTIVHLWGLTCGPCRIEMPEWGNFAEEHRDINLITIHAERLPPDPRQVREMLATTGLQGADNWMFSDSFLERLRFEIDPKWYGELPMTLLIARDGTTRVIVGPADLAAVRSWIAAQAR